MEALEKNPGNIPCGAGYPSASWAIYYQLMKKVTGLGGRYVTYPGSSPTHVALLAGEIQFAVTGIVEHAEFLKSGKVRALAHFGDKPYHVNGYGDIPAITDFVPAMKPFFPFPAWSSFSLRADTPKPILKKIDEAALKASQTKSVKEYCENFHSFPMGVVGEEAQKLLIWQASKECWLLFEAGVAKKSPAEFGIPKP
jgi:tripartite-type tricarboxylate transporter receptor subunit TctC